MVEVTNNKKHGERDSVETLLRKLKMKCYREDVFDEAKKREFYISPSTKRNLERR